MAQQTGPARDRRTNGDLPERLHLDCDHWQAGASLSGSRRSVGTAFEENIIMISKKTTLRSTPDPINPGSPAPGSAVASGLHQGLRRPDAGQPVEQALDQVDLQDQGELAEDQLRDRRSRGAPQKNHRSDGRR
jgi:hypothetical protein